MINIGDDTVQQYVSHFIEKNCMFTMKIEKKFRLVNFKNFMSASLA